MDLNLQLSWRVWVVSPVAAALLSDAGSDGTHPLECANLAQFSIGAIFDIIDDTGKEEAKRSELVGVWGRIEAWEKSATKKKGIP
jgi:hypothetical protein